MTNNPTMKLVRTPIKNAKSKVKCLISYKAAAATIGVESKKEYFATDSRSIFIYLPTVMVIPDLETPGNAAANACEIEIQIDCFKVIFINYIQNNSHDN